PEQHLAAIARAIDHIRAGDIFQANICARLEAGFEGDPLDVFCSGVRHLSPAYAAFMDTGERAVVSLSPELFLRRSRRTVLTSPIKGTAALNTDPREFAASAKDRAENVMIVDLMRNDLGRVCEPGSIGVPVLARPDDRVGVRHLVSDVTGTLRDQLTDADLLRACFPPGSVTGAPKVRAMEIINELEATGREVYTGAIGYASPVGGLESNVAIRTFEFAGDRCWLGVGGGVVADSNPRAELAECFTKAVPLLTAIDARLSDTLRDRIARPDTPSGTGEHRLALTVDGARPDPAQGVFTTMLVHDGSPVRGEAHLKRLRGSAAALGFDTSIQHLAGAVRGRPALPGTQRVRIEVTADGVDVRTTDAPAEPGPSWRLIPVGVPGGLGGHKWADRRIPDELTARLADEPLIVDTDGAVLETARSNLFVVADDGIHTPPLDGRILPGVTRAAVLEHVRGRGIPTYERVLRIDDLAEAEEVFVTNAIRGVVPVTACVGVGGWPVGATTEWLR
ncbi:MAG TPA: bifunctional anthranilate synthase component I family protein/class IV aminotransferase, partial [Marmoricola sp.]